MPAEAHLMMVCPYTRCPVKYWPRDAGETCPKCGLQGQFAGVAVKEPTVAPAPAEEGS